MTVNDVLAIINNVVNGIVTVAFVFPLIYIFLFFLKKRTYPTAKEFHRVGVIVCAKDESAVIGRTLENLTKLNYPKDKFEILIVADNCEDNTAEIARNFKTDFKIRVFERFEENKKKRNVGWALNWLFNEIKDEWDNYDFFVRFDADGIPDKEYISKMNDAYESGVKAAKGYNHASNLTQNTIAGVSGLWYIRDNRFNCHSRAALHTDVFLVGGGMMFSSECIKEDGGWIATNGSEDTKFTIINMDKKRKNCYVPDAIVYEDQPSTIAALFKRNVRMGHSLNKLFWTDGIKCLFKFFTRFRFCYLDMFLNLLFIPIAFLCVAWYPAYYIYLVIYNCLPGGDYAYALYTLWMLAFILAFAFIIPFIGQALLAYCLDKKTINQPFKKVAKALFLFPIFMIIYALGIVWGIITIPKWKSVPRNVDYLDMGPSDKPDKRDDTKIE